MPLLKNARWELYAQHVANGMMLGEAYKKAGFTENKKGNLSRLRNRIEVDRRITELLSKRASKVIEKVAIEIEYTREKLLAELESARKVAEKAKNGSAMGTATLGKAKILGLIMDRREVGDVGAFDHLTDEELVALAAKKARELGIAGPHLVEDDSKAGMTTPNLDVRSTPNSGH
jgi:hypothetical protein